MKTSEGKGKTVVVGLSLTERTSGETTIGRFRFVIDSPGALSQE